MDTTDGFFEDNILYTAEQYRLAPGDDIWVSADSFEDHWLKPGTVLVNREYNGRLIQYKLDPGCYFLVKNITYKYKPKWWEFWRQPIIDGYILTVWDAFLINANDLKREENNND